MLGTETKKVEILFPQVIAAPFLSLFGASAIANGQAFEG